MKKTFLHSTLVAGAAAACLLFSSCEDAFGGYLDKQPSSELTEDEVFSDWALMEEFHFDTYNFLLHGASRVNDSWLDAATDLSENSYSSCGTRKGFNLGNYYTDDADSELTSIWESRYRAIRKCNQLLANIESVPQDVSDSDEVYANQKSWYTAEARFLRAWFYWELFLRYGPIPIVTDVLDPNGDLLSDYNSRPTIKEYVVDFVLNELAECESGLMTYSTGSTSSYAGRIVQPMARALYSRIMLYMASDRYSADSGITWAQAAEAAQGFMDDFGSNYSLWGVGTDPVDDYTNAILYTPYTASNTETIFYRNDVAISWSSIQNDTPVGEGGNGGNCPSQNLVDMYDMEDGTSPFTEYDETGAPVYNESTYAPTGINSASGYSDATMWENRDPRFKATVLYHGVSWGDGTINVILGQRDNPTGNTNATPTGYYMRKYIPESILADEHSGSAYRLWIIIRYAEILLNYAEAMNEVNGPCEEVYEALDAVRHRGGITGNVADRSDLTSSQSAMRNFIRKERAVELCFEEHRWWDLRRWNVAEEALSRPIYGIDVDANGNITRKLAQNRVFESQMYLYPIPETEYWKANIDNNPGW